MTTNWKLFPWRIAAIPPRLLRTSEQYHRLTDEKYRINEMEIADLRSRHGVDLPDMGREFLKNTNLQIRHHFAIERVNYYLNRKSRDGRYIEVLEEEYPLLQNLPALVKEHFDDIEVVEVGLNTNRQICKFSYLLRMPSPARRFLFFIIGADGGCKTMYLTPERKRRGRFQRATHIHGLEYLSLPLPDMSHDPGRQ